MAAMRLTVTFPVIVVLPLCLVAAAAAAFSADGHRIAGAVAEQLLCADVRREIAPLLDGATLADAGVWADTIRDDPAWRHTLRWHYINVEDRASIARAARASEDNVLAAIARNEAVLLDRRRSRAQRADALRFLVHFVADVHQPLHVGRAADRGGNDVDVLWGRSTLSLHEFWDARGLLRRRGLSDRERAEAIAALAAGAADGWRDRDPVAWAEESRAWRPFVYSGIGAERPSRLGAGYVAGARNVVELRLAQAGVRIAERLNRLGCRSGPPRKRAQAIEPVGSSH